MIYITTILIIILTLLIWGLCGSYINSLFFAEKKAKKNLTKYKNLPLVNISSIIKLTLIGLRDFGIDISIIELASIKDEYVIYKYKDKFYRADTKDMSEISRVEEIADIFSITMHLDYLACKKGENL